MKTIHNWAARGELAHFRTPGRHLRFEPKDVLDFLRKYGYPVPDWLTYGPPRVVLAGPPTQMKRAAEALVTKFRVATSGDLLRLLIEAGETPPDAIVLFLSPNGECGGLQALNIVAALQAHPRTRSVRLVTVGAQRVTGASFGASAHLLTAEGDPLQQTLASILGVNDRGAT